MAKKRVKGRDETHPVRQKKDSGNGGFKFKYPFISQLDKGKSLTIEGADQMEGNVTKRENVRRLAYEFGLRHGMKFKVSPIESGRCTVTRTK